MSLDFNESSQKTVQTVKDHYGQNISSEFEDSISKSIYKLQDKWKKCARNVHTFIVKNSDWLQCNMFSDELESLLARSKSVQSQEQRGPGRPSKEWPCLSIMSKQRKTQELLTQKRPQIYFLLLQREYTKKILT